MEIISCHLYNFASYESLDFTFDSQGLALIQGATGSGKSTLCDAIPWVLWGRTAKDGAVDEVRSWTTSERTYGHIIIDMGDYSLYVTRTRQPNDLYYIIDSAWEHPKRGKDLNDTQKLINNLLGMDLNLYLSGAYLHEFSQTSQFFTTTAKNRRLICEQLVDLSLAKTLQKSLSEQAKETSAIQDANEDQIRQCEYRTPTLNRGAEYEAKAKTFEADKQKSLQKIAKELDAIEGKIRSESYFNEKRRELQKKEKELSVSRCQECGNPLNGEEHVAAHDAVRAIKQEELDNRRYKDEALRLQKQFDTTEASENTYHLLAKQCREELIQVNTALSEFRKKQSEILEKADEIDTLLEVVDTFRGATIASTIENIQDNTNKLLTDHYDAEIRVLFEVVDADKLDVTILKDGNQCAYTQLSKGQRQLLKLTFGISVMRTVANHNGISFNCCFLDECLEGLDESMKVRTFGLLSKLATEYSSVFVVDHSEALKAMFTNSFEVELVDGNSVIK